MAVSAATAAIIGGTVAAGGSIAAATMSSKGVSMPDITVPTVEDASKKAKQYAAERKRSIASGGQSIFTSPLGLGAADAATIGRKILLGQ